MATFHSPKNLAMALSVEVAEVVEHFQWLTEEQSRNRAGVGELAHSPSSSGPLVDRSAVSADRRRRGTFSRHADGSEVTEDA